jgi:hypothetical protein
MAIPEKFKNIVHIANLIEIGLKVDFLEDIREIKYIEEGKSWKDKLNYMKCNDFLQKINSLEDFTQITSFHSSKENNKEIQTKYRYSIVDVSSYYENYDKYDYDQIISYCNRNIPIKSRIFPSYLMPTVQQGKLIKLDEENQLNKFHYEMINNVDIGTILIFLPNKITGGNLVFKLEEDEFCIDISKFTEITAVIFSKVLYKFELITSGIKYLIKSTIVSSFTEKFGEDFLTEKDLQIDSLNDIYIDKNREKYITDCKNSISTFIDEEISNLKNGILYEIDKSIQNDENINDEIEEIEEIKEFNMRLIINNIKSKIRSLNNKLGLNEFRHTYKQNVSREPITYVLGYCYNHSNINSLHPNLIKFIREAIKDGKKVMLIYCTFKIIEYYDTDKKYFELSNPIPFHRLDYSYLESPINGNLENYNKDENIYYTYKSSCIYTYKSSCLYIA